MAVVWSTGPCVHGVVDSICWACTFLGETPIVDETLSVQGKELWSVPRYLPGATILCLGAGWSLDLEDVDYAVHRAPVIAINDAYRLAPFAEVHYSCDRRWWDGELGARAFWGRYRVTLDESAAVRHRLRLLNQGPRDGLSFDPQTLHHGQSGGYQALNLAVLLGASRVVLMGFDYRPEPKTGRHYWHGSDRYQGSREYSKWTEAWPSLVEPLKQAGVEVVNCTPGSAVSCFAFHDIREVL